MKKINFWSIVIRLKAEMVKLVKSLTVVDLKKIAAKWNILCTGNKPEILAHVTEGMIHRDLDLETYDFTEELERDEIEVIPAVDMSAIFATILGIQKEMQNNNKEMQNNNKEMIEN